MNLDYWRSCKSKLESQHGQVKIIINKEIKEAAERIRNTSFMYRELAIKEGKKNVIYSSKMSLKIF